MSGLFDSTSGEFFGGDGDGVSGCDMCARYEAKAEAIEADLNGAERDLRKARRYIRALEAEIRKQREESPEMRTAKALFRYWVRRLDKPKGRTKFGEKRQKAVLARLNDGYPADYLARAIDGLAVGAYTGDNGVTYDDLELAMRNEVNVERFHRTAEAMSAPTMVDDHWREDFLPKLPDPEPEGDQGDRTDEPGPS